MREAETETPGGRAQGPPPSPDRRDVESRGAEAAIDVVRPSAHELGMDGVAHVERRPQTAVLIRQPSPCLAGRAGVTDQGSFPAARAAKAPARDG